MINSILTIVDCILFIFCIAEVIKCYQSYQKLKEEKRKLKKELMVLQVLKKSNLRARSMSFEFPEEVTSMNDVNFKMLKLFKQAVKDGLIYHCN